MRRRLLIGTLSATVFVLVVLAVPLGLVHSHQERDRITAGVQHDTLALTLRVHDPLIRGDRAELRRLVDAFGARTEGRAVVVDAEGVLLADSEPRGEGEREFASRPEIAAALAGREVRGSRHSSTLGTDLFYVAAPVVDAGQVRGAVRVTYPMSFVESHIRRTWLLLGAGGLLVVAHPFRHFFDVPRQGLHPATLRTNDPEEAARLPIFKFADCVEVINGNCTARENAFAAAVADVLGLPATAGSDAHYPEDVGRCWTVLPAGVGTVGDVILALRSRSQFVMSARGFDSGVETPQRAQPRLSDAEARSA